MGGRTWDIETIRLLWGDEIAEVERRRRERNARRRALAATRRRERQFDVQHILWGDLPRRRA